MTLARRASRYAIAAACVFAASSAQAHSPIEGLGAFYSHFLHPLLVPAHALLLVATALMLGQQGRTSARVGVIGLAVAFGSGLLIAHIGVIQQTPERLLLAAAAIIGGLVSFGRRIPAAFVLVATLVAGSSLGIDSGLDSESPGNAAIGLVGLVAGVCFFGLLIAGLTVEQAQPWLRIGVRIAGSWIVAATLLVLALSIAPLARHTSSSGDFPAAEARPC